MKQGADGKSRMRRHNMCIGNLPSSARGNVGAEGSLTGHNTWEDLSNSYLGQQTLTQAHAFYWLSTVKNIAGPVWQAMCQLLPQGLVLC